jgi:hypothetical protein
MAQPMQQVQPTSNSTMPQAIYEQAYAHQLGAPVATYKPPLTNPLAIIGVVLGAIVLDILVLYGILAATGYIFYILIAIPIAAIGYGVVAMLNYNLAIYQFMNGLVRAKGQQVEVVRWDRISALWIRMNRRRNYSLSGALASSLASGNTIQGLTLQRDDGRNFSFSSLLRGHLRLIQSIEQNMVQFHLPRATAAYQSGQVVPFGPLSVSRQGISNGRETLGWNEVQNIEINRGNLLVKRSPKGAKWASVDVAKIPNLAVFVSLTSGVRSGQIL